MTPSPELYLVAVTFSFLGACVGYWMCWERNKPRNHPVIEAPRQPFDIHAEIERIRADSAKRKASKRKYSHLDRRIAVLTAMSL